MEILCQIPSCGRPFRARGYCASHLKRLTATGDVRADEPIGVRFCHQMRGLSLEERIAQQTAQDGECIVWTGHKNVYGYGLVNDPASKKQRLAHVVAYELANGPVPEGLEIDHLCNNRPCVSTTHLEAVTHRENMARVALRNRAQKAVA